MHIQRMACVFVVTLLSVLSLPQGAHAQNFSFDIPNTLPNTENALFINATPEHPTPGSAVRLKARSVLIDLPNSTLTWYVNDTQVASGSGLTEATITMGKLGTATNVSVKAESDITTATASLTLVPTTVDLLWESDTYIPPFYDGRALPSAGSMLRLQAIPWLKRANGSLIPVKDLIFTWKRNNYVLGDVSGKGKASVTINAPRLFGTDTISVDVASTDGTITGTATARIATTEPLLTLYKDHPLFGILYNNTVKNEESIPENEMTFVAVPYFAPVARLNDRSMLYAWQVNDRDVDVDITKPNKITINASQSSGIATIRVALTHTTNFFLNSLASWRITLNASSRGVDTSVPMNDAFHGSTK